jgi:hypothetical protein
MKVEQAEAIYRQLRLGARDPPQAHRAAPGQPGHSPPRALALSRRQFLRTSGAALLGASVGVAPGSRLRPSRLVAAPGDHEPIPIPGAAHQS